MYCITYIIKQGDTLYKISRHFNVSIDEIMKANPLVNVYNLMVDEAICIPVNTQTKNYTNFTTYLVADNDTLGSVVEKNEIDLGDLLSLNDLKEIYLQPGTTLKLPITGAEEGGVTL
ncbi:MAG TPA: LysM peptidoglycan-binding domain-containing protein [Mobilitalea sp.]|nr:LysM peptidoglycan-binding domain-containing protein [Mobilitalea sp.]